MGRESEPEEVAALTVGADNAATAEHEKQVKERNEKFEAQLSVTRWHGR